MAPTPRPGESPARQPLISRLRLLGTLAYIALIFFCSTKTAGDASVYAFNFYRALLGLKSSQQAGVQFLAQKGVHFVLFFSLGTWVYNSLNLSTRQRLWLTLGLCLAVGGASEALQIFTDRHPSIGDVLLNFASGGLAATLAWKSMKPGITE